MAKQSSAPNIEALMEAPVSSLVVRNSAKKSNLKNLSDADRELLHKKIMVNNNIAKQFQNGMYDEAQFLVIDDRPGHTDKTRSYKRGQTVSFNKNGSEVVDQIIGFKIAGSNVFVDYTNAEGETVKFKLAGISAVTESNGSVSLKKAVVIED